MPWSQIATGYVQVQNWPLGPSYISIPIVVDIHTYHPCMFLPIRTLTVSERSGRSSHPAPSSGSPRMTDSDKYKTPHQQAAARGWYRGWWRCAWTTLFPKALTLMRSLWVIKDNNTHRVCFKCHRNVWKAHRVRIKFCEDCQWTDICFSNHWLT